MEIKEINAALECLLFISGDPISLKDLSSLFGVDKTTLRKIINNLMDEYEESTRGLKIIEIEGSYQFSTKPEYFEYIEKLLKPKARTGLSHASLETLSIVAYKQPITKANLDSMRGVKSDACISRLLDKDLIKELGRLDAPGKPILYGTSDNFLRLFGLKSLTELPDISNFYE